MNYAKNNIVYQPTLFDDDSDEFFSMSSIDNVSRSGTFIDNMKLPIHRWFRYSAGFSAEWVSSLLLEKNLHQSCSVILDPFAGIGTTLIAANKCGIQSIGFETHPFVYRIAAAKLRSLSLSPQDLHEYLNKFLTYVSKYQELDLHEVPPLIQKCYTSESLVELHTLKHLFLKEFNHGTPESEILWLIITSILRSCSPAGTAQWQYILPNKSKKNVLAPYSAFREKTAQIVGDIDYVRSNGWGNKGEIIMTDARCPKAEHLASVDFVLTSPPYPNNYDYADALRLEMTFWGDIDGWADLQQKVRRHLIRSCSQHSAAERLKLEELLSNKMLSPIRAGLADVCYNLAEIRQTKGGKKTYHTMAAAYFLDMAYVFQSLRKLCKTGAKMCFVIGDSAPYGVYLPVDIWLGELAVSQGFHSYTFEKIRDRNTKWKNRKHTVPLKEGRLWVKG
ncbi:MAG TPA: DNA methyltransferase [Anaerohalosphaeraceae bacterium]|nr:DNA methyltransferase [Anaerohalosphaeraceae bacterium]